MPKRGEPQRGKKASQPPEEAGAFDALKKNVERMQPLNAEDAPDDPLIYRVVKTYHRWVRGPQGEKTRTIFPLGEMSINQHEPIVVLREDVPPEISPEKIDDWRYGKYVSRALSGRPQWKRGQTLDVMEFQPHRRVEGEDRFDPLLMLGTTYEGAVDAEGADKQPYRVPVVVQYVGTPLRAHGQLEPFSGKLVIVGHLRSTTFSETAPPTEHYALYAVNADWQPQLQAGLEDFVRRQTTLKRWETYMLQELAPLKSTLEGFLQHTIQDPQETKRKYELLRKEINVFLDTVDAITHQLTELQKKIPQLMDLPDPRFLIEEYGGIRKNVRHAFSLIDKLREIFAFFPAESIPPPPAPPQETVGALVEATTASQAEAIHRYLTVQQAALMRMFVFLKRVPDLNMIESKDVELAAQLANVAVTLREMAEDEDWMEQLDLYREHADAPEPSRAFVKKFERLKKLMPEIRSVLKRMKELHIHGDLAVVGPPPLPQRPTAAQVPDAIPERPSAPKPLPPEKQPIAGPFTDAWLAQMSTANRKLWETARTINDDLTPADIPNNLAVFEEEGKETEMLVAVHPTKRDAFFVTIEGQKTSVSLPELLKHMATGHYVKRTQGVEIPPSVESLSSQAGVPTSLSSEGVLPPADLELAPEPPAPEPFTEAWLATRSQEERVEWGEALKRDPDLQLSDIPNNLYDEDYGNIAVSVDHTNPNNYIVTRESGEDVWNVSLSGLFLSIVEGNVKKRKRTPAPTEAVSPPGPVPPARVEPPHPEPPSPPELFTDAWLATLDPRHQDSWRRASAAHPEISLSDIPNNLQLANTGERMTFQADPTDTNSYILHFGNDTRRLRNHYSVLFDAIESGNAVKRGSAPRSEAAAPESPRPPDPPRPASPPPAEEPPPALEPWTDEWLRTFDDETQKNWRDVQLIHPALTLQGVSNELRETGTFHDVVIRPNLTQPGRVTIDAGYPEYTMTLRDVFIDILRGNLEPRNTALLTRGWTTTPGGTPPPPPPAPRRHPTPPPRGTGATATVVTGFRPPRVEPIVHRPLTDRLRYLTNLLLRPFDLLAFSKRGRENNREARLQKEIDRREEILKAPLNALVQTWETFTHAFNEIGQQLFLYALQDPSIRQVLCHIDTLDRSEKFAYRNVTDTEKQKQMKTGPEYYVKQVLGEIHLLPDQREQIAQLIELEAELQRLNAVLTEIIQLEQRGGLQLLIDAHLINETRKAEFSDVEQIAISAENNAVEALKGVEREWSALPDDDARRTQALASIKDPVLHRIILGDQTATYRRGDRTYKARGKQPERFVAAHERQGAAMSPQNRKYVRGPDRKASPFANYVEGVRRGIALQPLEKRTKLWDETTKYLQALQQEMATARREYQRPDVMYERITQLETRAAERIASVQALWKAISTDPASRLAIVKEYVDWPGVEEIVPSIMNYITTHSGDYDWNKYLPGIYESFDRSNFRGERREIWMQKLNEHIAVLERKLTEALKKSTDVLIGRDAGTDADEGEETWTKKRRKNRR